MSAGEIFLIVVSGLGVIHGLFLAVILWLYDKGNTTSNKILSLLLIVLSFRIGKSVFLEFAEHLDVRLVFIGLASMMIIGPLFYLYVTSSTNKNFRLHNKHLLHFIPAMLGIIFGFWIQETHMETLPKLLFAFLFLSYYGHFLFYLILSSRYLSKQHKAGIHTNTYRYLRLLIAGLAIIWFAYVLNLFDDLVPYVVGPVLYSIVAYVLSFIVVQKDYIKQLDHSKYKTTPVSEEQIDRIYQKVLNIVSEEKQFKNADLSLKSLSEQLKVSPQILSMVINQRAGMNYNNFINSYRVDELIHLMKDEEYDNQTIAALAYEVGFNSISSFNTAFKKQTGKTPQAYRDQLTK